MKAVTKFLAGGAFVAALVTAAPAAAQYYPSPYGYGQGGNIIGQVLSQVLGGGYGYGQGYGQGYGYGVNSQAVTSQCINAVQARLARSYGNVGYGYGQGYGYNQAPYSSARVVGIGRVEQRSNGGLQVRGVATSGMSGAYGYGGQPAADISFRCRTDYRGYLVDVDLDRINSAYGYNQQQYTPYNYDYSQYGYRRY